MSFNTRSCSVSHSHDVARADNLKLTLPSAFATLQLAWGLLAAGSGSEAASSYDELAWGTRYLMACQQVNGSFVAQARPFLPNTHSVQGAPPVSGIQLCAHRHCMFAHVMRVMVLQQCSWCKAARRNSPQAPS